MDKQEKTATVVALIGIFGLLLWALLRRSPVEQTTIRILDEKGNPVQESAPGSGGIFEEVSTLPLRNITTSLREEVLGPAIQNPFNGSFSCPSGYQVANRNGQAVCVRTVVS